MTALKARNTGAFRYRALSDLTLFGTLPGALPQAFTFRAFGAFDTHYSSLITHHFFLIKSRPGICLVQQFHWVTDF
jgi:hypothetical protein